MYTLGISCYYHDSAACLSKEGKIIGALQEERFSRIKNDDRFPVDAITTLLKEYNVRPEDIDLVVYYEKPFLTFERLLETFHATWPAGFKSFLKVMPLWVKEKIFLKSIIKEELEELGLTSFELLFPEHHHSHLASAFYPSPYEEAAILTLDGVGEWKTLCLGKGKESNISLFAHQDFPHSLGLFYSGFTAFCGFAVNRGEYKLMGLAPYAKAYPELVLKYKTLIKDNLIHIQRDGSFTLNLKYFKVESAYDLIANKEWESLFSLKRLPLGDVLTKDHAALALACQEVTEEVILSLAQTLKEKTGCQNLCLSGGVALNSVANGRLSRSGLFDTIFIQPAAGDAGSALGASLIGEHLYRKSPRTLEKGQDSMKGSLLGNSYDMDDIQKALENFDLSHCRVSSLSKKEVFQQACEDLACDKILGWFRGKMEFGPRALGSRSILANPANLENQQRVNLKVKKREGFRPFAPALIKEDHEKLFGQVQGSPYMQFVQILREEMMKDEVQTASYRDLPDFIKNQLGRSRSPLAAITHVDQSCRLQLVDPVYQKDFYQLISQWKKKSGWGVLLNTSFNIRGEPIVESPRDALNCFFNTEIDVLYLENIRIEKSLS